LSKTTIIHFIKYLATSNFLEEIAMKRREKETDLVAGYYRGAFGICDEFVRSAESQFQAALTGKLADD